MALNYQTADKQNLINRAKFADNGGCGYILKPDFLRDPSTSYSTLESNGLDNATWKLKITVLSGQHLPKPEGSSDIIDPYVKVRIRGHRNDEEVDDDSGQKKNKGKTESVKNNGFNPVWNESFNFECKVPSLAFLKFEIKDHSKGKDEELAHFCCPLHLLQEGYRRVPLKDYNNRDLTPATLMVHITINKQN